MSSVRPPGAAPPQPVTTPPAPDRRTSAELGTLELLAEDFVTHNRKLVEPGLWAVAAHRIGTRAATTPSLPVRLALGTAYKTIFTAVDWVWGIHLPATVQLGRRVRLWHNGCMLLTARSIGNDVHIRHDTTFGPVRGQKPQPETLPGDRGPGRHRVGRVRAGRDPRGARRGGGRQLGRAQERGASLHGARRAGAARARMNWLRALRAPVPKTGMSGENPLPVGNVNANPAGMSLPTLLAEDFRTHGGSLLSPGFWALAIHRIGNWRMDLRAKAVRVPVTAFYRGAYRGVIALWGIDLPYNVPDRAAPPHHAPRGGVPGGAARG